MSIDVSCHRHSCQVKTRGGHFEGYEPKRPLGTLAMNRAKSLLPGGVVTLVNRFCSEKTQTEYLLEAARPSNLPGDDDVKGNPIQDGSRIAAPRDLMSEVPTGQGRGCQTAGVMSMATEPTVPGTGSMRTEGRLMGDKAMGAPKTSSQGDDLQRGFGG